MKTTTEQSRVSKSRSPELHPDWTSDAATGVSAARDENQRMSQFESRELATAIARLDHWFESMRGDGGYGGPVSHWWQQSLLYTGPALDWRYEGIIKGYLNLWERTRDRRWLEKAIRAGDDLKAGQQSNGHFRASGFELNPSTAGTPHEAACDAALLSLAGHLRDQGDDTWRAYLESARRNLQSFYLERLWDSETQSIGDSASSSAFVPNKAATACEALFLISEIEGDESWAERYALPTLDRILEHQVRDGSDLEGAIAQNSLSGRIVEKYFPLYIARCVSGLLRGYEWSGREAYLDCAVRAMRFVVRWLREDGSLPTVVYADQRVSSSPSWIAPLGDVLRAADELAPYALTADLRVTVQRLLAGQDQSGGIQTSYGFARQAGGKDPSLPDVRDILHVAGWCDKAFRYLTAHTKTIIDSPIEISPFQARCVFRGREMQFVETREFVDITSESQLRYRWKKGDSWPEVAGEEFWLR